MEDYFKDYHYQLNMNLNIHLMLTIRAAPSTGISTGIRPILFGGSGIGKYVIAISNLVGSVLF